MISWRARSHSRSFSFLQASIWASTAAGRVSLRSAISSARMETLSGLTSTKPPWTKKDRLSLFFTEAWATTIPGLRRETS